MFSNIVGLGRFSTGDWLVVDGVTRELHYYDSGGSFLRRAGGRGAGPEEFLDASYAIVADSDDAYVYDRRRRRVSQWSNVGELVDAYTIETALDGVAVPRVVGVGVGGEGVWSSYTVRPCVIDALTIDTVSYYRFDPSETEVGRAVARAPGGARWGNSINVLDACFNNTVPFSRETLAFAGNGYLYLASSGDRSVTQVDVSTGQERSFRVPVVRRPLEPLVIEAYITSETERQATDENGAPQTLGWQEYGRRLRNTPYPDSLPVFDQGVVDAEGWVWLRPYQTPADSMAAWVAFSPGIDQFVSVGLPTTFRPLQIGTDHIAGVAVDGFGIETVHVYGLSKTETTSNR